MEKTLLKRGISKIATEDGDPTSDAHEEASGNEVVPDAFISVPRKTDGPQFKRNKPKVGTWNHALLFFSVIALLSSDNLIFCFVVLSFSN